MNNEDYCMTCYHPKTEAATCTHPHCECASGSNGLLCDAPIRDYVPEDSLCKNCTKILKDCKRIHKLSEIQNGFNVVTFCVGFDDYRNT